MELIKEALTFDDVLLSTKILFCLTFRNKFKFKI